MQWSARRDTWSTTLSYPTKSWAWSWSSLTCTLFPPPVSMPLDFPVMQGWEWPYLLGKPIVNSSTQETELGNTRCPVSGDLGACLTAQPLLLGKGGCRSQGKLGLGAAPPGEGQAPSPSQLTAWQIIRGHWGHIHISCVSLQNWRVCILFEVRIALCSYVQSFPT